NAEEGGVRPDPERQDADRGGREARALAERAQAVAEVLAQRAHGAAVSPTVATAAMATGTRGARTAPMFVRCRKAERRTSSAVWRPSVSSSRSRAPVASGSISTS